MEPPGAVSCAAQQGTTFVIEDLFYNMDQRSKVCAAAALPGRAIGTCCGVQRLMGQPVQALGSASDEYARILDLVGRYAIARPDVAFSCKKQVGAGAWVDNAMRGISLTLSDEVTALAFGEPVLLALDGCLNMSGRAEVRLAHSRWRLDKGKHQVAVLLESALAWKQSTADGKSCWVLLCRAVHGAAVAQSLLPLSVSVGSNGASAGAPPQGPCFSAQVGPLYPCAFMPYRVPDVFEEVPRCCRALCPACIIADARA